ncbi:phosphate acyltransferase PlsX [bacterium]|nr:phosphate acyltransferase PlsX [bacterium]
MIRIAVDAMGGDRAPRVVVTGAIEAARRLKEPCEIVLVGDTPLIENELRHHHFIKDLPISIIHASQKVEMDDSPARALRQKPDSSIAVAIRLHAEGRVEGVVSAGNTGAVMASALFLLKPIEGVLRPAVGSFLPHEAGVCFLIDVGTNVNCKPIHMLQFGMMGSIFVNHILGTEKPKVGLLNIGQEAVKGNETLQSTYRLLEKSALNFIGNIEGRDIMRGRADVIVCDGFVGNILLKFGESLARMIALTLKRKIGGNIAGTIGHFLIRPKFRKLLKLFDYQEYGGAPLLGVKGNCIISHGSSGPRAIRNAIRVAWNMAREGVTRHIENQIIGMKGVLSEK